MNIRKEKVSKLPRRALRGFTLVEIILVASLLAVTTLAYYRMLASGLTLWQRAQQIRHEEDVLIFFDKIHSDLRNAVAYSLIPFHGEADRISFAALLRTSADAKKPFSQGSYATEAGAVEYYFDRVGHRLCRRQANYSQALKRKFSLERTLVLSVRNLRFRYLAKSSSTASWKEKTGGGIPAFVEIQIEFEPPELKAMTKLIRIPIGG